MIEEERVVNAEEGGNPPSSDGEKPRDRRRLKSLIHTLIKLAAVAGGMTLICLFVICPYAVHGNRMFPKLRDGDCAVVLKVGGFQKGDVVTYRKDGVRYFSRIVGTAGDHITIGSDGFRVNGLLQTEEVFYETTADEVIDKIIEKGEAFLLNDYRSDRVDGRRFGSIPFSAIDGKVVFLFRWRGI